MAPTSPRLKILSVGGNAVSAFLSWRLQATHACDVTLVWRNGFESVSQYGISFKSSLFGNERFKPRQVVRSPEEAAQGQRGMFDYVLLCVKALPDVYDIASIIESVVTPQHTCILINTSNALGFEALVEERFPKNVVLSLVSAADITQLGGAEFEHKGGTSMWVGPANENPDIPASIQSDMAEALAITLGSGQVECHVSKNIQQQQFEKMIGPIAFHSASVLFETPNHTELLELKGLRSLITETIDELLRVAEGKGCRFPSNFKDSVMEEMIKPKEANSVMYQDYAAKRPMEVETYLGSPLKLAQEAKVDVPRLETLYAMLHHVNIANQKRPAAPVENGPSPTAPPHPPQTYRMSSAPTPRPGPGPNGFGPAPNGHMNGGPPMRGRGGSRAPSMNGPPPGMRRGPMNGMPPRGPPPMQRRPSFDGNDLDEFSYLSMYGEEDPGDAYGGGGNVDIRERELMLREKELMLREREMGMRGPPGPPAARRPPPSQVGFDDDDDDDFFDPMAYRGPPVDPDNVDMMSITSRRNRKQPSQGQLRQNPEMGGGGGRGFRASNPFARPPNRNRTSSGNMLQSMADMHENVMENPLMGYSSDRYGDVDRKNLRDGSRTNSLTTARLSELNQGPPYAGYPPMGRRTSQSPGHPLGPNGNMGPPNGNMGPPNGNMGPPNGNGYHPQSPVGRPSPPNVRQPTPRHPPGHGNQVAPHQVEHHAGVSNLYPPKNGNQMRSLTGSASASAGSGDSGRSAQIESENSAYSSQSSLGPRPQIGVR